MRHLLFVFVIFLLMPASIQAQGEREIIPVDWKEVQKVAEENPQQIKQLVSRLSANEIDTTMTWNERILAYYGQSYTVKAFQGNAKDLSFLPDNSFDITLNFGPLYHLIGDEEKLIAMNEAKRVTKDGGLIFNAYVMNDYCILTYCFEEDRICNLMEKGFIDDSFHVRSDNDELYDYMRVEDIDRLNKLTGLERVKIFSPDGPSDYMRPVINKMSEESFEKFVDFQMKNAERPDLIGAGSHTVDIVRVHK